MFRPAMLRTTTDGSLGPRRTKPTEERTMRTTMIAVTMLAAATQAQAGTLGTISVGGPAVTGTLDTPGPQKWTVNLRRGHFYALAEYPAEHGNMSVHAAGGKTVVSSPMRHEDSGWGVNFTAPYTGSYTIQVACEPDGCPGRYELWAEPDCRADAATACRIAPGNTLTNQRLWGEDDWDWIATNLVGGKTYQVSVGVAGLYADLGLSLAIRDGRGRELPGKPGSDGLSLSFTAPASGTYFVEVTSAGWPSPTTYSLTVR